MAAAHLLATTTMLNLPPSYPIPLVVLALTISALALYRLLRVGSRDGTLPPGPPTKPLIGNLGMFPADAVHFKFTEWARIYGPIMSLKTGPETVIILSGIHEVKVLMDQRSVDTAGRPRSLLWDNVLGETYMANAPYGETWKTLRRISHNMLNAKAASTYLRIQQAEAVQLLYDITQSPDRFFGHTLRYSESVILSVLFGTRCPSDESKQVITFHKAAKLFSSISKSGALPPVDILPILQYIPERWANWKRLCREFKDARRELSFDLLAQTEERVKNGNGNGCFMEGVLSQQEELGMSKEMVTTLGLGLIDGGTETTSSFLQGFILFLTAFPNVQKRAQEEIDTIVGSGRLPSLADFESLPYLQALVKEAHRFRPLIPLALPHAAQDTINYKGYIIPKGTTIIINIWGIYHDPNLFEDPESFSPERYLNSELGTKEGVDNDGLRATLPFGCGRRICPGMNLANNSLMYNTMYLLWAFNFSPGSRPVDIWDYKTGLATAPNPFECKISVRGEERKKIIEREFAGAIDTFMLFEEGLSSVDQDWLKRTRNNHHGK